MAYLTYLIDFYGKYPETIAFIHPHRDGWPGGWHTDAANYDNVNSLNELRTDFVQQNGYVNLRCLQNPGCPDEMQPFRKPNPDDPEDRRAERIYPEAWKYIFGDTIEVPRQIGAACCSQFAISGRQALARSLDDYKKMRKWLLQVEIDDYASGRVFEYMWHIIFGKEPV